ncbi:hypothetical protein HYT56_02610 [Candidatus Woesearchaeota archaeon]|nr:hypothetical protein [Candidatus Woesearchaeota archaeon]
MSKSSKDNLRKALRDINSRLNQISPSFLDNLTYVKPAINIIQRLLGLLDLAQLDGGLFDKQYKSLVSKLNSLIEKEHLDESWTQFITSMNDLEQNVINSSIRGRRDALKKAAAITAGVGLLGNKAFGVGNKLRLVEDSRIPIIYVGKHEDLNGKHFNSEHVGESIVKYLKKRNDCLLMLSFGPSSQRVLNYEIVIGTENCINLSYKMSSYRAESALFYYDLENLIPIIQEYILKIKKKEFVIHFIFSYATYKNLCGSLVLGYDKVIKMQNLFRKYDIKDNQVIFYVDDVQNSPLDEPVKQIGNFRTITF